MLESKESGLEIVNQYVLKERLRALEVSKEELKKEIVFEEKNVRYLSDLLDKEKFSFYFSQIMFFVRVLGLLCFFGGGVWLVFLVLNYSKIVFAHSLVLAVLGWGYLCLYVDFGVFFSKLSFYRTRSLVADNIIKKCDCLDSLESDLKEIEMKIKTLIGDSEGNSKGVFEG